MRLIKNTVLLSFGLYLLFLAVFFARNTYIPANEYMPAILLNNKGEPISLREKEKPIVVMSGWGTPIGFDKAYDDYIYWRTSGGVRVTTPDQKCTEWHAGTFPYQVEMSRLPFAAGRRVEGFEKLYDSRGTYRISEDGQRFDPIAVSYTHLRAN